jgi:hypothetical protein
MSTYHAIIDASSLVFLVVLLMYYQCPHTMCLIIDHHVELEPFP